MKRFEADANPFRYCGEYFDTATETYFLRARWYDPATGRFTQQDAWVYYKPDDPLSLNLYLYCYGNPVGYVDPSGFRADFVEETNTPDYQFAIFVSDFRGGFPINYTGHTQLYFMDNDGTWYLTEFAAYSGVGFKEMKANAKIQWKDEVNSTELANVFESDKFEYVVLYGDFDKSVALAKQYAHKEKPYLDFGDYNFFFNNCSHYTDALLKEATVNGFWLQSMINKNSFISVPVIREMMVSFGKSADNTMARGVQIANGFLCKGSIINSALHSTNSGPIGVNRIYLSDFGNIK